jgi:hypothetical protein
MPFSSVKERTRERFTEVQIYLNFINTLEPREPMEPASLEVRVMKGLFYVHLYAALEKSVNDVVETFLSLIASKNIKNNHFTAPMLSIALADQIKSLKDTSHSKLINKSVDIFVEAASANVVHINETVLSRSLQNIWMKTINEAFESLCISPLLFSSHEKTTVDEVVDKRNAVAHGRDSAASVGERYRVPVLREKMETISVVTNKIIDSIEEHCLEKKYIKPTVRRHYP